jgi:hypothetical protein
MRHYVKTLTALAFAATTALVTASPAAASGYDITITNILSGNEILSYNDIDLALAALVCGNTVEAISLDILQHGQSNCLLLSDPTHHAKITPG